MYCRALTAPLRGTLSTDVVIYHTSVEVRCDDGFMFPDRNSSIILKCVEGTSTDFVVVDWNATYSNCQR